MWITARIGEIKRGRRELRNFGLTVGAVLCAIGLILLFKERPAYPYFIAAGLALAVSGLLIPNILKYIYIVWMALSILIGLVVTTALLTVLFYLIITPVGLVARILGRRAFETRFDRRAGTYWIRRPSQTGDKSRCEKQY